MSNVPSLGKFQVGGKRFRYPGPSPSPFAFHIQMFFVHSSSHAIRIHSVVFFTSNVSVPFGQPFTYSLFLERVSSLDLTLIFEVMLSVTLEGDIGMPKFKIEIRQSY